MMTRTRLTSLFVAISLSLSVGGCFWRSNRDCRDCHRHDHDRDHHDEVIIKAR